MKTFINNVKFLFTFNLMDRFSTSNKLLTNRITDMQREIDELHNEVVKLKKQSHVHRWI